MRLPWSFTWVVDGTTVGFAANGEATGQVARASTPHMPFGVVIVALIVITAIFWMLGMRSFLKRAVG